MSGYRPGPRFGWLGALVGLVFLGVVAVVAYQVGLSAGAGAQGTAAPVVYGHWFYGGFGFFGFLFFLLILFLIFRLIFRPWGWGHGWRGGYGRGWYGSGWYGSKGGEMPDVPPPFEPMLESWHRRAHGETPPPGEAAGASDKTGSSPGSTPG